MPTVSHAPPPPSLDAEFARVLRIADPGPALDRPLTFLPPAESAADAWLAAWEAWRDTVLATAIAPRLAAASREAQHGRAREIQSLDLALGGSLDPSAALRSRAAGRHFLRRLSAARGERWLGKLQFWAASGHTPAHFATVYAAQSALFHLSRRLLLPGYAYWEWTAAMSACPPVVGPRPAFARQTAPLQALGQVALADSPFHAAETFPFAAGAS